MENVAAGQLEHEPAPAPYFPAAHLTHPLPPGVYPSTHTHASFATLPSGEAEFTGHAAQVSEFLEPTSVIRGCELQEVEIEQVLQFVHPKILACKVSEYTQTYIHIYTYVFVYMYAYMYCGYAYTHVYNLYTNTCSVTRIDKQIHICTWTRVQV